ncbi:glycosyltransferase family 4 protein [Streptococcus uberis]|uniref:glycosyltransferase family 4 protein n=1 Tax=Streptococcus uberis TaxID=1349 RepID=UPI001FF15CB7|nr:glycosyltransferase family 4 protein [Streptococcus uberis]MCK1214602.1 glycosyltransferase family 4 protein [Streptococcus uberis]
MKICLIAHLNDLSGANKSLLDLADFFRENFEVVVVIPRNGSLNQELQSRGIRTHIIPSATWVTRKQETVLKKFIKKVLLIISEPLFYIYFKKENFDIIHFNSSIFGSGAKAARKLKIPFTWHIRELAEDNFSLIFLNRKKTYKLINSSVKVVTISNFMKDHIKKNINSNLIEVIYNGIKPTTYKKIENNKLKSLVIIGAIAPDKGQIDAIRAVKVLKNEMNLDIPLKIVGAIIDQEYYNFLLNEITDDIQHLISFTGYEKDVSKYRKLNNIALICSKAEAFGRVTIEGMNQQQIVIGANSGATPEIIDDNLNGFLYNSGDFYNLAQTIYKVLNLSDDQITRVLSNASHKVKTNFNIKNTVKRLENLFLDISNKVER